VQKYLLFIYLLLSPLVAQPAIQIHTCYGTPTHLIVEGRVLDARDASPGTKSDGKVENLKNKLGQLFNDEFKDISIVLSIGKYAHSITSDDEGYFHFEFTSGKRRFSTHTEVKLSAGKQHIAGACKPFIFDARDQTGVISDFDDTVIISGVTHKMKLLKNTFFKNYTQREVVAGMPKRFHQIMQEGSPLFFVTGSPRQLQGAIEQFLDLHHFPKRTVIAKKIHGDNSDPLFDQIAYKYEKIKSLILLYPTVRWVLFGDSGEKDPEVYARIRQAYPSRVKAIYIRDVESGKIAQVYSGK